MYHNIIFIGGIHGVGKGTVCSMIQKELDLVHLSASEVLKWSEFSPDIKNKFVGDIPETQDRLIQGLQNIIESDKKYLLDGHFCLFNSTGEINRVDIEIFIQISPIFISVVTCDIRVILERLEQRDSKHYNVEIIEEMQNAEVRHGQLVAQRLGVPFFQLNDNTTEFIEKIRSL